jgi:protein-S-isoprenylcysteine O-methyltransferase Ste14
MLKSLFTNTVGGPAGDPAMARAWEIATRVMNVAWVALLLLGQAAGLSQLIVSEGHDPALLASSIAARLASVMFLCVFVVGVVARASRVGAAAGLWPRVAALVGSFLPTFAFVLPRMPESLTINVTASALCALGFGLAAWAFAHLNRSASIMPEARSLVTTGPYRLVRHPVYLFEAIGIFGVFLPFEPLWAIPAYAVHCFFQLQRMRCEERVLTASFPEYAAYAARTRRVIPGVY